MKLDFIDKLKKYAKLCISYTSYSDLFKILEKVEKKRAILIGTPIHGNLGDSLIAQQCKLFLEKRYENVVEIPEFFYEIFSEKIKVQEDDDIYICGGGWMGNLYEDELVIEDILLRFPNNRIIILPQTVAYSNNGKHSTVEKMKNILGSHAKLIVCMREENSYNLCLNELSFSKDRCLLLPDMALLALSNICSDEKIAKKVIFSIRNDVEKCTDDNDIAIIRNYLCSDGYACIDSSTVIDKKVIRLNKRDFYISEKVKQYSSASLIITDRLHSMVFALLAGCKCIAIDNSTRKVSGVYKKWLTQLSGLCILENSSQLSVELVVKFLNSPYYPTPLFFENEIEELNKKVESL